MKIEELFGTLMQSSEIIHEKHLQSKKYSAHIALNEFYEEMPDLVDALIEAWQAEHDPVEDYVNLIEDYKDLGAQEYLKSLKKICKEGKELLEGESELESCLDDVLNQIDSTLYKLSKLTESHFCKGLSEALCEALED